MKSAAGGPAASRRRIVPIALSQGLGLACGIAGVKLTSRLVAPADYGAFAVFVTLAPVGMWFVHAGPIKFINRHWAAASASERNGLLDAMLRTAARRLPWLGAITAATALTIARESWLAIWLILFVTAALLSIGALAQAALQATQRHWRDFGVSAAGSITRSFAPPLLYAAGGASLLPLCAGFGLHAAVGAALGLWCLREYMGSSSATRHVDPVYDGPLFAALAFAGWVMAGLQRWIVAAFFGATDAGYFALAASLATLVPSMLGTVALQYFQPALFAHAPDTRETRHTLASKIDRIALGQALLSLAGLLTLKLIAPLLVGRLIGERYGPALDFLFPAGCAMLALVTGWFYHSLLLATRRERACGPVELSAAALIAVVSLATAWAGQTAFTTWLMLSPLLPWIVNRPLARFYIKKD